MSFNSVPSGIFEYLKFYCRFVVNMKLRLNSKTVFRNENVFYFELYLFYILNRIRLLKKIQNSMIGRFYNFSSWSNMKIFIFVIFQYIQNNNLIQFIKKINRNSPFWNSHNPKIQIQYWPRNKNMKIYHSINNLLPLYIKKSR